MDPIIPYGGVLAAFGEVGSNTVDHATVVCSATPEDVLSFQPSATYTAPSLVQPGHPQYTVRVPFAPAPELT